jgi:hypothetical protein
VYDNQGLVRRMYGDIRHLYVMQSEAENEIDFEDIRHSADKYSKAFNEHNKHNRRQGKAVRKPKITTTTKSGERKTYRNNGGDTNEPHFRPAQRPAALNSKQRTKPPKTAEKNSLIDNLINSNVDASADEMKSKSPDNNTSDVSGKTTKLISITTSSLSTTPNSLKSISEATSIDAADDDDHLPTTKEESDRKKNETVDKTVLDLFGNISSALSASSTATTSTLKASEENEEVTITERNVQLDINAERDEVILDVELITEDLSDESDVVLISATSTSKEPLMTTTTEAQLFQDSVVIPTPINRRGV